MLRKSLVVITWKPEASSREKQVLLLKLIPQRGSFWQPVTGKPEGGESYAEGALREAMEETGFRFERRPQYLGLDTTFKGKEGKPVCEKAFLLPLVGGEAPPTPTLDPKEHVDFVWLTPEEAVKKARYPGNKEAIRRASRDLPPLFLSRSGSFFQEGEEITHERTALLLHKSLQKAGEGYLVRVGEEELEVVVEDLPRVVRSFDPEAGTILLSNGEKEELDPQTLKLRKDHAFSCRTQEGLEALFLSPAHYELAKSVEETSDGKFLLRFRGRNYQLSIPS